MSKPILITGATGKQGGAVLRSLLAHPSYNSSLYPIYALTRNTASESAKRLVSKSPSVRLIAGDLNDTPAVFSSLQTPPWGVFSVQLPGKREVAQGKGLIDEALKAGVKHFVFTSVDRGGEFSSDNPTKVGHFTTKHEIEKYLIANATGSEGKMTYTILRPVFFLDNLEWGFIGKMISTAWRDYVPTSKPLQVIATTDIGSFGAAAFLEPDSPVYRNAAISLAGDELTFAQANELFKETTGRPIPTTYGFLVKLLMFFSRDIREMFKEFATRGFGADVERLQGMGMRMRNFKSWSEGTYLAKAKM